MSTVQGYKSLLGRHDWHYGRSDDPKRYRAGQSSISELHRMRMQLDPTGSIWNSIAPAEFQVAELVKAAESDPRDAEIAALRRALGEQAGKGERLMTAIQGIIGHPDLGIEAHRQLSRALDLEKTLEDIKQRKRA